MRLLTSRRRHPLAKPLALLLALVFVGTAYAALAPATKSTADGGNPQQVTAGQGLYQTNCSSCHGLNGEGTSQGKALIGVGAAAVDFQMSTGRMPAAGGGVQVPRKPTQFTEEEIADIAAYVATLGPGPAIPGKDQYSGQGLSDAELARGGELFRTNCSACHNFAGEGGALPNGKYAPSLVGVEDKHIYEAMRTGPQEMPVFSKDVMTDQDVKEIIGYLDYIHSQPSKGGLTLGGIGPVAEGLFAWVIGIGALVLFATWIAKKGARAR